MSINALLNPNVATIRADAGITEAAKALREMHVGDLVVVESRQGRTVPIGIVTDRDIVVGVIAREVSPEDVTVADLMSSRLVDVKAGTGVEAALKGMREAGVRRVPVTGSEGELVGILSIDDVVSHLAAQLGHIASLIVAEQEHETRARP